MAHFAELDESNVVQRVLVVDNEVITKDGSEDEEVGIKILQSLFRDSTSWKQTSYNATFRKNYAGKGMKYDEDRDAFINTEAPYLSWRFNETNCRGESHTPYPDQGEDVASEDLVRYHWEESSTSWEITLDT